MLKLRNFFQKNIEEIRNDPALRIYGAFIALGYFLCYSVWKSEFFVTHMASASEIYCWPFWENCFASRIFTVEQTHVIMAVYGLLSIIGIILFFFKRYCSLAYWWLILVTLFKTLIYVQDYALRMNQHYMLYFITLVYLFMPYKRNVLRIAMVLFYFWASTLKFNYEWMSGQAMHTKPFIIPWRLLSAACVYAVVLEFLIVWGTLAANRKIFWVALSQLALFHIASWNIVGYFYPTLMFGLLMIFPLVVFFPKRSDPQSLLVSIFQGHQPKIVYGYIFFFSFLQLVPMLMPGDEKVTGEGRLFALHMIDAKVKCRGAISLKFKDGMTQEIAIPLDHSIKRTQCEPAMNFSVAKRSCYLNRNNPDFVDLDLYYEARRATVKEYRPLVDIKDFCRQDLKYHMLRPNDWILKW